MSMKIGKVKLNITGPMTVNVGTDKQLSIEGDIKKTTQLREEHQHWLIKQYTINSSRNLKAAKVAAKQQAFTDTMTIIPNLLKLHGYVLHATLFGMRSMERD